MMEALSLERLNVLWSQGAMSKRTDCKCVWSLCASVCACNKDLPKKPWFQYAQSCNDRIIMINWGENRASSHTVDRSHFQICWETYQQLVFCFCLDPITTTLWFYLCWSTGSCKERHSDCWYGKNSETAEGRNSRRRQLQLWSHQRRRKRRKKLFFGCAWWVKTVGGDAQRLFCAAG